MNDNGQTYGPIFDNGEGVRGRPDLILAVGIDGTDGFIMKDDFDNGGPLEKPTNPEEAVIYMEQLEALQEEAVAR